MEGLRDPKVGDEGSPRRVQQDVFRFDVAMDDALRVGLVETIGHITGDPENFLDRRPAVPIEFGPETLARHQRHDEIRKRFAFPVERTRIEQRQDMRVLEGRDHSDLAEESVRAGDHGGLRAQDFDGNATLMARIFRAKDRRHATAPDFTFDSVSMSDRLAERLDERFGRHGC